MTPEPPNNAALSPSPAPRAPRSFLAGRFRYPLYGLGGLLLILALFYIFAFFDPNTLVNARQGFKTVMDAAFGAKGWRAEEYAYSYQNRAMTVKNLWINSIGIDSSGTNSLETNSLDGSEPKNGFSIHVDKLVISHLAWAKDLKALLNDPRPDQVKALASNIQAEGIQFITENPKWRIQGQIELLEIDNLRFSPPDSPKTPASNLNPLYIWSPVLAGLRPDKAQLAKSRFRGQFIETKTRFALTLPSWTLVKPRLSPRGFVCSPGSLLAGLGFGLKTPEALLSGRVDDLAHDGALGLGYLDNLALRNLALWLDEPTADNPLARVAKKTSEPFIWELTIGDADGRYVDFRPLAQRLAQGFLTPKLKDLKPPKIYSHLTASDLLLGSVAIYKSHWRQVTFKIHDLTTQVKEAELAITVGQEPYSLTLALKDGWYSLANPQTNPDLKSEPRNWFERLNLTAGRFNFSAQASLEPNLKGYQLGAALTMDNLFDFSFNLGLGGLSRPLMTSLKSLGLNELLANPRAIKGLTDVALRHVSLRFVDLGLTERALSYYGQLSPNPQASDQKEKVIFGLALALTLKLENYLDNAKLLTDRLASFLRRPSGLTLEANPAPPISYMGYQAADTLGDLLSSAHFTLKVDPQEPVALEWRKPWRLGDLPFEAPIDWLERQEPSPAK